MEEVNPDEIMEDLRVNGDFYRAFNEWLEMVRTKMK